MERSRPSTGGSESFRAPGAILWPRSKVIRGLKKLALLTRSAVANALVLGRLARASHRQGRRLHLIALVEHFGDIVACEPVIERLRQAGSKDLVWIACREYGDLVRFHPVLRGWIGVTCLTEWAILRRLFWFVPRTDLHIDRRACNWFGVPVRNRNRSPVTLDNYYLHGNLLTVLSQSGGLDGVEGTPAFHFGDTTEVERDLAGVDRPFAVFHCRSNEASRDWSSSGFERLARFLVEETPLSVVEIGLEPVLPAGLPRIHRLCGRYRLDQYGYLISRSALFVGVDSGFAHVANAVGTFGVILLGHYLRFERYTPYSGRYGRGEGCLILHHEGPLSGLDAEEAIHAVRTILPAVLSAGSAASR